MTTSEIEERKLPTVTFRLDPEKKRAFRLAVFQDGDTLQRLLEEFVDDYLEKAEQGG